MAHVPVSKYLSQAIVSNVKAMFQKRKAAINEKLKSNRIGDQIYDLLVPENERKALQAVSREFLTEASSLLVVAKFPHQPSATSAISFLTHFSGMRPVKMAWDSGTYGKATVLTGLPDELSSLLQAITVEIAEIEAEEKKLITSIQAVLDQSSTLKQVLTVWPSAIEYCPDDIRVRHNASNKRTKRDPTEVLEQAGFDAEARHILIKNRLLDQ